MYRIKLFFALLISGCALQSCYYDNLEELRPGSVCDSTSAITYNEKISGIMNDNCVTCHNSSLANGSVNLESYAGVKTAAESGKLYSSVVQDGNAAPMPKSGNKLNECSIAQIKKWINSNYPQ